MLPAMPKGSYDRTDYEYEIVKDINYGWAVRLKIDGIYHESGNSYRTKMLAAEAVHDEARVIIRDLRLKP